MSESIKKFKNIDELIKDLESRHLIFPDEDSKNIFKAYLKDYGYFSVVKKLSNPLMYDDLENRTYKKEFTSNNLRYLFDIDRNISVIVFKYFRNIEFLLNSSILKIVAKKLNKHAKCPYIAALNVDTIDNVFPNVDTNIPRFKKWTKNNYVNLYEDLFKNINNDDVDIYEIIQQNKNNEKEEIIELIKNGWLRKTINTDLKYASKKEWEYIDIFSLFQIINFSQLLRIFSYLSVSDQNEVIKEFCSNFKSANKYLKLKVDSFEVIINCLSSLRNILMHNGTIIKFRFNVNNDVKDEIEKYFNISIDNVIKVNDVIKIIELIINIDNQITYEINSSIINKFKSKTNRPDEISNILIQIIEDETRIKIKLD